MGAPPGQGRRVGVVGAGTMGAGIAQVGLEAGDEVLVFDIAPGAMDAARARIADGLVRRAARLGVEEPDAWVAAHMARLRAAGHLEELAEETSVVVEAAVEDITLKRVVFATLDAAAAADVVLATNTSALSIAAIAADAAGRGRIVGLHFFNPAPVMPLVEVVAGPETSPTTVERAEAAVVAWGKTPIRCTDAPGFVVNRVNRPFTLEALRLLESGAATIEEIDAAVRAEGFPQGPFEHIDLIGLDVNLATSRAIHAGLGSPPRLAPSELQARLVGARRLGRKSGVGFYEYDGAGHMIRPGPGFGRRGGRHVPLPSGGPRRADPARARERGVLRDRRRRRDG